MAPVNRSKLRFSLRLLFALLTLVCIALAVWSHRARQQRQLVEQMRLSGGKAAYHQEVIFGRELVGSFRVPQQLVAWLGEDYFYEIEDAEILDVALLSKLPRLRNLESLHINAHTLTDNDFEPVSCLRRLKAIDIYGDHDDPNTQIGTRSLALLAKLPELELINLESFRVTAGDLDLLADSKSLEKLYVASPHQSLETYTAELLRSRLSHLTIRRSIAGGFGKIVVQWQGSSPPAAPAINSGT